MLTNINFLIQIGIDVEEKTRKIKNNIIAFAKRFFSPNEIEVLSAISDPESQRQEFIKLWTLKVSIAIASMMRRFSTCSCIWDFRQVWKSNVRHFSFCCSGFYCSIASLVIVYPLNNILDNTFLVSMVENWKFLLAVKSLHLHLDMCALPFYWCNQNSFTETFLGGIC